MGVCDVCVCVFVRVCVRERGSVLDRLGYVMLCSVEREREREREKERERERERERDRQRERERERKSE